MPAKETSAAWPVTLAADIGRLPPYDGVPAEALARPGQLLARHPAISLHDHPVRLPDPLTPQTWQAWRADGREPLGYAGLAGSGWAAVVASALSTDDLTLLLRWARFLRDDMQLHPRETVFAAGPGDIPAAGGTGSSDIGNVSLRLPAIHPYIKVMPRGTPGHSHAMTEAVASMDAHRAMLRMAAALAKTGADLFCDGGLLDQARKEFAVSGPDLPT